MAVSKNQIEQTREQRTRPISNRTKTNDDDILEFLMSILLISPVDKFLSDVMIVVAVVVYAMRMLV